MTIVFQFISAIGQVAAVFYTLRLLALVGRPKAGALVTAGLTLLAARTVYALTYNTGQYDQHHAVVITELMMMLFSLSTGAGLYFLRIHARTRALSRLNPQAASTPASPTSASTSPNEAPAYADAGDPQIICNSDMEITDLNQGASRLLGRERDDVCGKSITNIVRKEEMLLVPELFWQAKAGEAHGGEWSFRKPDDTLVPVRISVRSHFNDQVRLIVHDLTDERKAQQSTGEQSQNATIISKLLDASSEAYVAYDEDLKIVAWNTRMEKLTGIPRVQCMNQHLLMHFPIPEELAEEDYFLETLEGHSNDLFNATIINPDSGDEDTVDHHFAPLVNDAQEIIGGMVVIRQAPATPASATVAESETAPEAVEAATEPETEAQPIAFNTDLPAAAEPVEEPAIQMADSNDTESAPANGSDEVAQYLNNVFAAAPHIITVYDLNERRHIFFNRSLPGQLGFSDEMVEAMGDDYYSEIVHPEDQPNLPRSAEAWNDGSNIEQRITEFRAIDPERNWHWYLATDHVFERAEDGTIQAVVSIIQDITEQKEGERQLRHGEQKYRTFSEHCPTGIWHLTAGGNTHYMNPAMCRILGVDSVSSIEGRSYHEFITPDSQLNIATQSVDPATGEAATIEVDLQRPDGSLRHCILHGIPDLDEAGNIRSLMGSFLDVTDRAESENAIKAEQARYRAIVEQTPDLICRFDKAGKLSFINGAYCGFFGQTRDDLLGGPFAPKIPADETATIVEMLDSLDPVMQPQQFTCRLLGPNGDERQTRWTLHSVSDDSGSFIEYQAIARDITDQLTAEQALAASERKFRGIFEQSGVGIVTVANDGTYLEANEAYTKITGYTSEELRSLSVPEITHEADRETTAAQLKSLISGETELLELDKRYTKKDGTVVWAHVAAKPVRNDAGETDHLIAAVQDITGRRQAEEALRASEERANLAIEGTSDGIWDWQVDSDEVFYSSRFEELLGLAPGSLPSNFGAWRDLFHPDESDRIMQRLNEHLEARDHYADEIRIRHHTGDYRWYRIRGSVTGNGDGRPTRMSGSLTDIDSAVKAREALRASEATFRSLAENTSAVPWQMDPTGQRFTFVGPQAERIFGHPADDWTAAGFFELYLHEDDQWVIDHLARHVGQDDDFQFEYRFRTADNEVKWVHQVIHVGLTEGQTSISGFLIDITTRKEAELALAERERQFRDLCTHAPAGIFLNGPEADCAFANPKCRDLVGLAEDDEPKVWRDRLHPDDAADVAASFEISVREQTPFRREYRFQHPDGKVVSVRGEIIPQFNENEELTGFIGTLVDLTPQKQAEQQLKEKEALLTSAIDSLPFDFWACDRASRYILQNRSSENRWGSRIGKKPEDCGIDAQIVEQWHQNNHRALKGETVVSQVRYPHEDQQRDFQSIVAPIQEGKEILGFLGVNIDVTDLKQAEAALTDSVKAQEEAAANLKKVEANLAAAHTRLAEAEAARNAEKESRLSREAELDTAQASLAESAAATAEAKDALEEAALRQNAIETSLHDSEAARDEAEATLKDIQAELENTVTSLTDAERARKQAETKLGKAKDELKAAKSRLEETETVQLEVQTSATEAGTALATAEAAMAKAESARGEAQTARDKLELELEETKSAFASLESEKKELNTSLATAKTSLTAIGDQRDEAQMALKTTQGKLDETSAALSKKEAVSQQVESEKKELSTSLATAQASLTEIEALRDEAQAALEKIQGERDAANAALSEKETAFQQIVSANEELSTSLATIQTSLTETAAQRDEAQSALEKIQRDLDKTNAALSEKEAASQQIESAKEELSASLAETQRTVKQAETDRQAADLALAKSEAARDETKVALKSALTEIKTAASALTDAERARDAAHKEIKTTNAELQAAKSRLTETETVHLEVQTSKDETGAALATAQAALVEAEATRDKGQADLTKMQNELKSRAASLADAEQARDEAQTAKIKAASELKDTTAKLAETEAGRGKIEAKQEELNTSFAAAKQAASEAASERDAAKDALAKSVTELEQTKAKIAEIEEASTSAQAAQSESENHLAALKKSLAETEVALAAQKTTAAELDAKCAAGEASLQETGKALEVNQAARRESERRLAILLQNIPGIAYRRQTDDSQTLDYISVGCAGLTGHAPEEFTSGNVSLASLIHPDDREQMETAISAAIEAKIRYQVEYRLTHTDGTERKVSEQGSGVFENDKDLIAVTGVITEIAPKLAIDLTDSPINSLPESIWITDVNDRTVFFNQSWCSLTGTKPDSGLNWTDAVHGEDRARLTRAFKEAVTDREPLEQEFRLRRHDGVYLWMRMMAVPRRDARNRFTGYMGSCFDVSPSIHDREELKANQRQLEWAQTRAKLGSWEYHPGRNFRRWSKQTMELYNRRPEQGLPADFEEFLQHIHEDDRPRLISTNDQVLKTGRAIGNLEFRTNPDKGPQRHLTATVYRVPEEDGSAYYLAGTVMDISDQKATEENVRRSEERYRKIIEIAEEGVWMMDAEGYTSFVNPRMMQMLGYRYREFIGRHFFEFLENESIKDAEEYLERRQQGISEQAEFAFLRKDGKAVNVLINSSSLKDADGDFIGVLCMVSDITARKAANAKLDEAQEKIRTVLATAPDFIMTVDRQKIIRFINRPYAGMNPEQVIGTPALNWITPDDRENFERAIESVFTTGEAQELEVKGLGSGTTPAWYSTRIGAVKEDDKVASLIVVSQDITQRKTAQSKNVAYEHRLQVLSRKLLAAQETERRMIANELHDQFGQALSATKINLQALAKTKQSDKDKKRLDSSLESLENLIQQTRRLSLELRPSVLDDLGLVPALRWLVTNQADSVGYQLEFDAPELDRFDADLEAAAFRLTQEALTNIARHAKAQKVSVKLTRSKNDLKLKITDNGAGFDVEAARAGAARGDSLGILGMEERIALVGGAIEISSDKGKGTSITASIPLPAVKSAAPAAPKTKKKAKTKRAPRKKSK
jgi:PAS domain S-box-containing protein